MSTRPRLTPAYERAMEARFAAAAKADWQSGDPPCPGDYPIDVGSTNLISHWNGRCWSYIWFDSAPEATKAERRLKPIEGAYRWLQSK